MKHYKKLEKVLMEGDINNLICHAHCVYRNDEWSLRMGRKAVDSTITRIFYGNKSMTPKTVCTEHNCPRRIQINDVSQIGEDLDKIDFLDWEEKRKIEDVVLYLRSMGYPVNVDTILRTFYKYRED